LELSRFKIIEQANQIGASIWEEVITWKNFERNTLGKQLVRAADSISANLCEAYGRFSIPDRKRFAYYARGSLCETINWLSKSIDRKLFKNDGGEELLSALNSLSYRLNAYIRSLRNHPSNP
jgi:four helix bundle protein